jgi:predicted nucleic acid-binding protein
MIYLDSSVLLAQLLRERREPPEAIWQADLVSSRLLEYEVWVRMHARGLAVANRRAIEAALAEIVLIELAPYVLRRALEPFPVQLRTLDVLHVSTIEYLRDIGQIIQLASYDQRLNAAARALEIELVPL